MFNLYMCRMEQQTDIRWIQRYINFHRACMRLVEVTEADRDRLTSKSLCLSVDH